MFKGVGWIGGLEFRVWGFPQWGTLLGGPHIKDNNALRSILGSRNLGKLPH